MVCIVYRCTQVHRQFVIWCSCSLKLLQVPMHFHMGFLLLCKPSHYFVTCHIHPSKFRAMTPLPESFISSLPLYWVPHCLHGLPCIYFLQFIYSHVHLLYHKCSLRTDTGSYSFVYPQYLEWCLNHGNCSITAERMAGQWCEIVSSSWAGMIYYTHFCCTS